MPDNYTIRAKKSGPARLHFEADLTGSLFAHSAPFVASCRPEPLRALRSDAAMQLTAAAHHHIEEWTALGLRGSRKRVRFGRQERDASAREHVDCVHADRIVVEPPPGQRRFDLTGRMRSLET